MPEGGSLEPSDGAVEDQVGEMLLCADQNVHAGRFRASQACSTLAIALLLHRGVLALEGIREHLERESRVRKFDRDLKAGRSG